MLKKLTEYLINLKNNILSQEDYLMTEKLKSKFDKEAFKHNNFIVIILGYFLFFEQLFYAFFVREPGSAYQQMHFITAILMILFAVIATYIYQKSFTKINKYHKMFVVLFVLSGLLIAIVRTSLIQLQLYSLPTIYLAVIYGMAVAFYFPPILSFKLYSSSALILILLLSGQPIAQEFSYVQDIISNNIIAWIVSVLNFNSYYNGFIKSKKISDMNQKLRYLSVRDPLTDLFNRRKLDDLLAEEIKRSERANDTFSVIILDIDDFKNVNDLYGHNIGDKVLIDFSEVLLSNIRGIDKLGRWGGEEFLIIAPGTDNKGAEELAKKLKGLINSNDFGKPDKLTASFGVATYNHEESVYQLINRADKALYQAKTNGKNRVNVYKPGIV